MLEKIKSVKRKAGLVMLNEGPTQGPLARRSVRGQNFLVEWFEAKATDTLNIASDDETMVILFDTSAKISDANQSVDVRPRSLSVLPDGAYEIKFQGAGRGCVLSTTRKDVPASPRNATSYETQDTRVAPVGLAWPRTGDTRKIQVFDIDKMKAPPDNPRLKMFQSATMSINWVDYDGPRDRSALSPHSHRDFEQASLAVAGDFIHHLRVEWGKDANEWQEDEHKLAGSPSVLVIPPDLIHTTEGVGTGHHLLIDVFAPPRRDFIAKNWVANASEYVDPRKQQQDR
jgi:hypothetical protein